MPRKGSIDIELSSAAVASGDVVRGQVTVDVRKELGTGELRVDLVAEADDGEDFEHASAWKQFAIVGVTLDRGPWLPGTRTFEFELPVPNRPMPPPAAPDDAGLLQRRAAKRAGKAHAKLRTRYRIEARLETSGRNLRDKAPLRVDGQKYRRTV